MTKTIIELINTATDKRFMHDAAHPYAVWAHRPNRGGMIRGRFATEAAAQRSAKDLAWLYSAAPKPTWQEHERWLANGRG